MELDCHCKTTDQEYLYVISVISNPNRYNRRYQLFNEFVERMSQNPRVKLYTTELQTGNRPFATNATFKIRNTDILWHKENLLNYTAERLPPNAKYIAWIDSDLEFQNKHWAEETIEALQIYNVVQPWRQAIDMGPKGECMQMHQSFCYLWHKYGQSYKHPNKDYHYYHPGYAWAFRREVWSRIGGMMDFGIVGAGDHHMAMCFIGRGKHSVPKKAHKCYIQRVLAFESLCEKYIEHNIGYVEGIVHHFWHGKKKDRRYQDRWSVILDNDFNPDTDISYDINRILQLNGNKPRLRDDLRNYFNARNEDSVDLE